MAEGDNVQAPAEPSTGSAISLSATIEHPRLGEHDAESIRTFLRLYDQYVSEVKAKCEESGNFNLSCKPVNLAYCLDPDYLDSAVELGFIPNATSMEELTEETLRKFLENKAVESKETITLSSLDALVKRQLRMNTKDPSAESRMQSLFISYRSLLRQNGLLWVLESSQKIAVQHVLSAIRPKSLCARLSDDLEFSQHHLRKDFKGFMSHAIKLAAAFQLVDNGQNCDSFNPQSGSTSRKQGGTSSKKNAVSNFSSDKKNSAAEQKPRRTKLAPLCVMPKCKEKKLRHYFSDCPEPAELVEAMRKSLNSPPAKNTRAAVRIRSESSGKEPKISGVGKLQKAFHFDSPECDVTIQDGLAIMQVSGQCDDGSDDSLASPIIADNAVTAGIGTMTKIEPVTLQVALKKDSAAQSFQFSRKWSVPRLTLHLASGKLAVLNISFLVADDDLASQGILIGRPVLQHLKVDTRTLLEENRAALDGTDCATVGNPTEGARGGYVSMIMNARANNVRNPLQDHLRPRINFFGSRNDEDPFPNPNLLDLIQPNGDETNAAIEDMLNDLKKVGLKDEHLNEFRRLVYDYSDIFCVGLSPGSPTKFQPLKINLTPDAKPVRVKLRNYSQDQRDFLRDFVNRLVANGMAYPNPSAIWASAPLLVPKPGPARFRFTVDLRPVNKFTVQNQYPMPNIECELTRLAHARYFSQFDLSHGYWQFGLDKSSQECQSFLTPDGIYTPTRVLHGTTNATTHLQSVITSALPPEVARSTLTWLDDILQFSTNVASHLVLLEKFFKVCRQYNLKLNPKKCILLTKQVHWCGRIINENGIRLQPRRIDGLLSMQPPKTGSDLQQFVCALQWVKSTIPNFTSLIMPLQELLEKAYASSGKRTKRKVSRVCLQTLGWNDYHAQAFQACKDALAKRVTLAHRDIEKRLCVFTDASEFFWGGIVTQIPTGDITKAHVEKSHEPLAFISGKFNSTQIRWSTLEKEGFAIMETLRRMHWIVATSKGFDLFTDHNNLIFMFDPLAVQPDLSVSSTRKVLRWAIKMCIYNYTCVHIRGEENVWADLLTRWSHSPTVKRLVAIPVLPSAAEEEFDWPTPHSIFSEQRKHLSEKPINLFQRNDVWENENNIIWVPDNATDLQLRLCVIAHTSAAGHRGIYATEAALRNFCFWTTLSEDIRAFVKNCIHCLSTLKGTKEPRPFGPAVHGTAPHDLLQFDFIEMGPGTNGLKYILMLRDDFSSYCLLFPCERANAENAADALMEWCSLFKAPAMLMSDCGTHFKNATVSKLTRMLLVPHHFTLPHCPWSNGAVERLGREVLRIFRATLSELRMRPDEWPALVPVLQSALNCAPSASRRNKAPVTAFLGIEPPSPVSVIRRTSTELISLTDAIRETSFNVTKIRELFTKLHPLIETSLGANRERARAAASRGELPNFLDGDFVLVAREQFFKGEKLCLRWRGPRRIVKALSDLVYLVEDLRNGLTEEIHASRLRFYSDSALNTEAIMPHVLVSETGMQISRLLRFELMSDGIKVAVRWKGLPKSCDTLEPVAQIHQDVPDLLKKLLARKSTPSNIADLVKQQLDLGKRGV